MQRASSTGTSRAPQAVRRLWANGRRRSMTWLGLSPSAGSWQRKTTIASGRESRRSLPVMRHCASCSATGAHSAGAGGIPSLSRPPKRPRPPCRATMTTLSLGWNPIRYGSASASSAGPRRVMCCSSVGSVDSGCLSMGRPSRGPPISATPVDNVVHRGGRALAARQPWWPAGTSAPRVADLQPSEPHGSRDPDPLPAGAGAPLRLVQRVLPSGAQVIDVHDRVPRHRDPGPARPET